MFGSDEIYSKEDLRKEFLKCKKKWTTTHMLVVVDRFPFPQEDYVVYVRWYEDVRKKIEKYDNKDEMQEVIEVYSMKMDMEQQLGEYRAFHLD